MSLTCVRIAYTQMCWQNEHRPKTDEIKKNQTKKSTNNNEKLHTRASIYHQEFEYENIQGEGKATNVNTINRSIENIKINNRFKTLLLLFNKWQNGSLINWVRRLFAVRLQQYKHAISSLIPTNMICLLTADSFHFSVPANRKWSLFHLFSSFFFLSASFWFCLHLPLPQKKKSFQKQPIKWNPIWREKVTKQKPTEWYCDWIWYF